MRSPRGYKIHEDKSNPRRPRSPKSPIFSVARQVQSYNAGNFSPPVFSQVRAEVASRFIARERPEELIRKIKTKFPRWRVIHHGRSFVSENTLNHSASIWVTTAGSAAGAFRLKPSISANLVRAFARWHREKEKQRTPVFVVERLFAQHPGA